MKKSILFIAGSIETVPAVRLAKKMGYHVIVSDGSENAPCFDHADDSIVASTYDVGDTVRKALFYHRTVRPINGVICVASDVPLTVAMVAKELGLPGIAVESAQIAQDKLRMKERFLRDGVAIPWFSKVESINDLGRLVKNAAHALIIKPVDSRGARGVQRLLPGYDVEKAFQIAKENSPTGRVMVEEYIEGPQVSTESFVLNGQVFTPGFSDRNYALIEKFAPFMIEDGGDLPSILPQEVQEKIHRLVASGARSMGIETGVVKGDIVVREGTPYIIELAARLSGGYFCTHEIPMNTGVDLVGAAIRSAVNDQVSGDDFLPTKNDFICQRYMFPNPGTIRNIRGVEEVSRRKEILFMEVRMKPGDRVHKVESHPARAGLVIATGTSRSDAAAHAAQAVRDIVFEVE